MDAKTYGEYVIQEKIERKKFNSKVSDMQNPISFLNDNILFYIKETYQSIQSTLEETYTKKLADGKLHINLTTSRVMFPLIVV